MEQLDNILIMGGGAMPDSDCDQVVGEEVEEDSIMSDMMREIQDAVAESSENEEGDIDDLNGVMSDVEMAESAVKSAAKSVTKSTVKKGKLSISEDDLTSQLEAALIGMVEDSESENESTHKKEPEQEPIDKTSKKEIQDKFKFMTKQSQGGFSFTLGKASVDQSQVSKQQNSYS